MNPARGQKTDYEPARVTVAVLVHLPHQNGYHEQRLDVVKACLTSILENTDAAYDLMVLDNASCQEARAYLEELHFEGSVQYLIRSGVNLGKIGGLAMLLRAAPGEIVAYCDDDFYFYPGWLGAHLEVLETFPKVGAVSGYMIRSLFVEERISSNLAFAERDSEAKLLRGELGSQETWRAWALSTGRDPDEVVQEFSQGEDLAIEYRGLQAYAAANHDQFVGPKQALARALPEGWSGRLMGEMLEFDQRLNDLGYLRLATREQTTQHMGNVLSPELAEQAGLSLDAARRTPTHARARSWKDRLVRWPPIRAVLLGLYSRLFRLLNPES